jgi:hypothetical protein
LPIFTLPVFVLTEGFSDLRTLRGPDLYKAVACALSGDLSEHTTASEEIMTHSPLKDKDYDLISTVYHASQGLDTCRRYAEDANSNGDSEAADYFKEVGDKYADLVDKGKHLLKNRL